MIRLTFILIAGLVGLSLGLQEVPYEQIATDYFFEHHFKKEYPDVKVIEFSKRTEVEAYYDVVFRCAEWDKDLKGQIASGSPGASKGIDISHVGLKIKPERGRSFKLKLSISPAVKVEERNFVFISVYKRLHFVEYYIVELDKEGQVVATCKTAEII